MKRDELPIGFSMALAQNPEAMQRFALLGEDQKQKIIEGEREILSREEMHGYVNKI